MKWVFHHHTCVVKISRVARRYSQTVRECGGGNETVFNGHRLTSFLQFGKEACPLRRDCGVEIEDPHPLDARGEPLLKSRAAAAGRQEENAIFEFSENDGADGKFVLMRAEPLHDSGFWGRFGRLAQDVGVHQEFHSVSVDSEAIGWNHPFSGQASSQSTRPSLSGTG